MPPIPADPTKVALQNALFHWPRILFAWYVKTGGTFAPALIVARKIPKYLRPLFFSNPSNERPMMPRQQLKIIMGPRMRWRSAYTAEKYMTSEAAMAGGATRHCVFATEKCRD